MLLCKTVVSPKWTYDSFAGQKSLQERYNIFAFCYLSTFQVIFLFSFFPVYNVLIKGVKNAKKWICEKIGVTTVLRSTLEMLDTELYLAYDPAILIIVTDQTPGLNICCKLEFVDSFTHEINEN